MVKSKIISRLSYYLLRLNAYRQKLGRLYLAKNQEVLERITNPIENLPTSLYCRNFLTKTKIEKGVLFWKAHQHVLEKTEAIYKIPSSIIVAILGIESDYGTHMGNYLTIDALSTLAFSSISQRSYFQQELKNYLLLTKKFKLDPYAIKGSYAGAMGICQFMPTSYLNYALSYTSSEFSDLFNNPQDAIISAANFLNANGWKSKQPILLSAHTSQAAKLTAEIFQERPKAPVLSLSDLKGKGVFPNNCDVSKLDPELKANLIYFDAAPINYWLGFWNFYILTRYNNNYNYALAVFKLSKCLEGQMGK
jgi:membrane-bound lytic murein transglycosylase B